MVKGGVFFLFNRNKEAYLNILISQKEKEKERHIIFVISIKFQVKIPEVLS